MNTQLGMDMADFDRRRLLAFHDKPGLGNDGLPCREPLLNTLGQFQDYESLLILSRMPLGRGFPPSNENVSRLGFIYVNVIVMFIEARSLNRCQDWYAMGGRRVRCSSS